MRGTGKVKEALVWAYQHDLFLIPLLLGALAIRIYSIHLPGPYGDELTVTLPAYQMRWGQVPFSYNMLFFGRWLPVTIGPHTGALPIYVQFLFSFLAGGYWFGFRILNVLYALGAIALTYYFARDFLGRRAALISALLLTFMPSFVFYSRVGEHVLFLRLVLASGLLFCFHRWWKTGRWGYFCVGCFLAGLGLSTRLEMVWWLAAVPVYVLLAHRAVLREMWGRLWAHVPQALAGLGCLVLGAGLFVAYNVGSRGGTFAYMLENLTVTSAGQQNLTLPQNLWTRLINLAVLLNGGDGGDFGVPSLRFTNDLYPIVFVIGVGLLIGRVLLRRRRGNPDHRSEFLLFTTGLILALSTFTISTLRPMHLLMMMPLPVLIIARSLDFVRLRLALVIVLAALVGADLVTDVRYYRVLAETGGVGLYSSGVFDLVQHLREREVRSVIACDWRLLQLVEFVSSGEIGGEEIFGYELGYEGVPASFEDLLDEALQDPENVYLFYAPPFEQFKRHQPFLRYLEVRGLPYERAVLHDRNGPIYYIYRVPGRGDPLKPAETTGLAPKKLPGGSV